MIINDFDILCAIVDPVKANTILIVDSNTVLTFSIGFEPFQAIAWRDF